MSEWVGWRLLVGWVGGLDPIGENEYEGEKRSGGKRENRRERRDERGGKREKRRERREERKERRERIVCPTCHVNITSTFNSHFNTV